MIKQLTFNGVFLVITYLSFSQTPKYTDKHFINKVDTSFYKLVLPKHNGFQRTYIMANPRIWDIDDDKSTWILTGITAFLIIEGNILQDKREGIFTFYLLDSLEPTKKYKLWEQEFKNDKLNGRWNTYSMNGVLCSFQTYKNDSLFGIARDLWIDGSSILKEEEYFGSTDKFLKREYFNNGTIKSEAPFQNRKLNGLGRKFYENGKLLETVTFKDGNFDGPWKYYYNNGQLWIEKIYKEGKNWKIVSNYTKEGIKRNAGTLDSGEGNVIYYNEDGTVREIIEYRNGIEVK